MRPVRITGRLRLLPGYSDGGAVEDRLVRNGGSEGKLVIAAELFSRDILTTSLDAWACRRGRPWFSALLCDTMIG